MKQLQIILENNILTDKYTEYLCDNYDIQNREKTKVSIPMINIEELNAISDWNILLIIGQSGSGKTTILKALGEVKKPTYNPNKAIISQFPSLSESEACNLLMSVGLSSIPSLLRPYHCLSNGEQARCDIAWQIANLQKGDVLLIDEFTSVVNRTTAQSIAFNLQRFLRKNNIKAIIASCHFDIIDSLQPCLIYNLEKRNENNEVELERLIYSDDKDYELLNNVNNKFVLTQEKKIVI